MLKFKEYILEYLTSEQRARFSRTKMTPEARKNTDHFFGEGNDLVRHDIDMDHDKSEVHRQIEKHIGKEISHDDYRNGQVKDKYGRNVSIGKTIKDDKLRDQYSKDRENYANLTHHYATVVRGIEVAGQTNSAPNAEHPKGHTWEGSSCKNVDTGENRHYLQHEIKHGTVVTRIHDHNGQEIYRATHQPHKNNTGQTIYDVNSEYGIKHPAFTKHAHKVAKMLSDGHNGTGSIVHRIHDDVYDDTGQETMINPKANGEQIHREYVKTKRTELLSHPNIQDKTIEHAIKHGNVADKLTLLENPNLKPEHHKKLLSDNHQTVRSAAVSHAHTTEHDLKIALHDDKNSVQSAIALHPKITKEINDALVDKHFVKRRNYSVVNELLYNPHNVHMTGEQLEKMYNKPGNDLKTSALAHPNATESMLDKGIKSKYSHEQLGVAMNPKLSKDRLDQISKKAYDEDVVRELLKRKDLSSENVHHILDKFLDGKIDYQSFDSEPDYDGQDSANLRSLVNNKSFGSEHLDRIFDNNERSAKKTSLAKKILESDYKKLKPRHLVKALSDEKLSHLAVRHENFTSNMLDDAIENDSLNDITRRNILRNPRITPEQIKRALHVAGDNRKDMETTLLSSSNIHKATPDILDSMIKNKRVFHSGHYKTLLSHPNLSEDTVNSLIDGDNEEHHAALAEHRSLNDEQIHRLLDKKHDDSDLIPQLIEKQKLSDDHVSKIVKNSSLDDLENYVSHEDDNGNYSFIDKLKPDHIHHIVKRAMENKEDPEEDLIAKVIDLKNTPGKTLDLASSLMKTGVLSGWARNIIFRSIAGHKNTPEKTLVNLADGNEDDAGTVARLNPKRLRSDVLHKLFDKHGPKVLDGPISSKSKYIDASHLVKQVNGVSKSKISHGIFLVRSALSHPNADENVYNAALQSSDSRIQADAVKHKNMPNQVLIKNLNHPNEATKSAIMAELNRRKQASSIKGK